MLAGVGASAREYARLIMDLKTNEKTLRNMDLENRVKEETGEQIFESRRGLKLENDLLDMRNDFFRKNPLAFKLNAASGGINSASSLLRILK